MALEKFKRLPKHIGFIPDGNRRWAVEHGLPKEEGYVAGLEPAFRLYKICVELGIEEVSVYGFTKDNTHRAAVQKRSFRAATVEAVKTLSTLDAFRARAVLWRVAMVRGPGHYAGWLGKAGPHGRRSIRRQLAGIGP